MILTPTLRGRQASHAQMIFSSWAYADASAHRCGRMRRHWWDDKEGRRDRAELPIDPLRGEARLGQRRNRHCLGAERGGGARETEHIQSRPPRSTVADDPPSIGRPATNMRCAKCGQTFYSNTHREMPSHRARCQTVEAGFAPKPPTEAEYEPGAGPHRAAAASRPESDALRRHPHAFFPSCRTR